MPAGGNLMSIRPPQKRKKKRTLKLFLGSKEHTSPQPNSLLGTIVKVFLPQKKGLKRLSGEKKGFKGFVIKKKV
jgi:hypothetical protein